MFCKTSVSSSETKAISSPNSSSPFRFRLQKSLIGLRACSDASGSLSSSSKSSATQLKRKRPGRLDIPVAPLSFDVPETSKVEVVEEERDEYVVCCKRGKRAAMEDRYSAVVDIHGDPKQAFFGVFDGHGGAKAAEFAAENIHKNILNEVGRREEADIEDAVKHGYLRESVIPEICIILVFIYFFFNFILIVCMLFDS